MLQYRSRIIGLRASVRRLPLSDILALGALAIVAWSAVGFLLRDDVFLFGDHPGHYWVMWYTLNVAGPLHGRLIDWIPYWYAGYPELQFYPPGFVFFGVLLNWITLARFSTALIYETVVFIIYALPAFTFYYALRHWKFNRRAAFIAGLLGLVFPAFFDGATSVFIGMLGSRLAWALNALVLAWGIDWIEGRGIRYGWLTVLVLAAAILAHPYHLIGMLITLALYMLVRRLPILRSGARLLAVILFALALDAFWLLPLIAHSATAMIPLIRSTQDQVWRLLADAALWPYVALALFALLRLRREQDAGRRALVIVLVVLPFLLGAAMLLMHALLIEQWQFYAIDPVRLIGEYYFPLVLLAAVGVSEIGDRVFKSRQMLRSVATVGVGILFVIPLLQQLDYFHPKPNAEPRFLSQATRDYRLDDLWEILRATPGRVLFTSSLTNLNARGGEPFPTTLTALTPLFTNRPLMGGTYSHWSPIAALMWTGDLYPHALEGLVQDQDDRSLFGIPLETSTDEQLVTYCERFNVTAIVASVNDYQARSWLDASARFQSYANNGFFFVYRVNDYEGTWLTARNAKVELLGNADDRIDLRVRDAQQDASVQLKFYAYPLWQAYLENGQSLTLESDDLGMMQIALPRGEDYRVMLRYEQGLVELAGNWISAGSGLLFGVLAMVFVTVWLFRQRHGLVENEVATWVPPKSA